MSDFDEKTVIRESVPVVADEVDSASSLKVYNVDYNTNLHDCRWLFEKSTNQLFKLCSKILGITLKISSLPKPDEIDDFRQNLLDEIQEIKVLATEINYPVAVIDKTCCIFAIVIDEFVHYSSWGEEVAWGNKTLLSELFSMKKNGGELFFLLTDKAIRQPQKLIDFIELIYLFLSIGFKGQFRYSDKRKLKIYHDQLRAVITKFRVRESFSYQYLPTDLMLRKPSKKNWYLSITLLSLLLIVFSFGFMGLIYNTTIDQRTQEWLLLPDFTGKYTKTLDSGIINYLSTDEDFIEEAYKDGGSLNSKLFWFVQLKSFKNRKDAYLFINKLSSSKFKPFIHHDSFEFFVRVKADSLADAKKIQSWYKNNDGLNGKIIKISDSSKESKQ